MKLAEINPLALAYLGDSIYEVYIRKYLVLKGVVKVDTLQKEAVNYVSAKSQFQIIMKLLENNFLNDEEIHIVKKGRNTKAHRAPKNTD
ncbi:MAG: ribonuclease III domain-containing protein, partial [Bacilli bacterium]|nr:ribonuclease III domain-containing protein [Bacilli bacterium]